MAANLASLLAQVWALSETSKGAKGMASKGRQGRRVGRPISRGLGGMNPTNEGDMKVKPLSPSNVPKSIPRNIQSLIAWDSVKVSLVLNTSTGLVETNFTGALNVHPQAMAWQQLYDQWSIPQMTVEFDSLIAPGSISQPAMLYTALDFDSNNNIGSVSNIEDFSSCEVVPMTAGRRTMRSIRPSVKLIQGLNGGGTSVSGPAGPQWVDSGQLTTAFYCIRSILTPATGANYQVNTTFTIWFCFRNQI